jgi:putative transcriptional regulator
MGLNLKIARIKKGLSQKELAKLAGISPATVSKAENGKINLRIDTIKKISKVLDTPIMDLFFSEDK